MQTRKVFVFNMLLDSITTMRLYLLIEKTTAIPYLPRILHAVVVIN